VYEVYLEKAAENDLKRLPTTGFHRIIPQIRTLAENPRPSGCRKLTGSKND
jgi:mRNA interferase RelE/StbE